MNGLVADMPACYCWYSCQCGYLCIAEHGIQLGFDNVQRMLKP
ncbi:hypothetical protein [Aliivibrio fischeri]|nr:hypothetical protein [Aliivibrio fischeri]